MRKIPAWAAAPAQEQLGVGQQGTEVDHSADADEEQDGEGLAGLDANLKEPLDDAVGLTHALAELIDDAGQGQVDQDGAEAMGSSRAGSNPFSMASQIKRPPTTYISSCCHVIDRSPSQRNSMLSSSISL